MNVDGLPMRSLRAGSLSRWSFETMRKEPNRSSPSAENGSAIVFFAFFILFLMGAAALAIDLGMLYVARSEAQRSADAAALAGANVFTGTCTLTATCETPASQTVAAQDAVATAEANSVAGQPGSVNCNLSAGYTAAGCSGILFTDPTSNGQEPQITVTVQRTGISLIFARLLGVRTATVSAVATAEAYMGGAIESHVAPFLVPNCDPNTVDTNSANAVSTCYNPSTNGNLAPFIKSDGTVENPELYTGTAPGAIGEPWTLHYAYNGFTANASGSVSPSQWSMVSFPNSNGTYNNSNSTLVSEIESGPSVAVGCGTVLQTVTGNRPNPIDQAVNQLIGASADGPTNYGQDYFTPPVDNSPNTPYPTSFATSMCGTGFFSVTHGSGIAKGNPFCGNIGDSNSIVLAPLFDANTLNPGNQTVTVSGFAVLMLDYSEFNQGQQTVQANVINLIPCGGNSNNGNGVVADASPIPIRLIQHPN